MLDVISRHDPARMSVHAYSLAAREVEDAVTGEFRRCCTRFTRIDDLDNREAARAIAEDRLDLLVDLMGHSGSSRPGILLYKPAPVIVSHLGSHGAIGLQQIDFKLTDRHADLPDAAEYGDVGSNTLAHVAEAVGGLALPNLEALGLGNIGRR